MTVTQAGLPAAAAIGSVTITGNERSVSNTYCVSWLDCYCRSWRTNTICDTGTVSVTVNGHTDSVSYGQGSTPNSLAIALANAVNNDSASYVQAGAIGSMVWLVSKATQGDNYPFSSSSTTTNTANSQDPLLRPLECYPDREPMIKPAENPSPNKLGRGLLAPKKKQ